MYNSKPSNKMGSLKQDHALDSTRKDTVYMDLLAVLSMKVFKF